MTCSPDDENVVWKQRGDDMSWREIDGEVIVLDLKSATYLRFNPSGALLWRRLDTGSTGPNLAKLLAEQFGLPAEQARQEVVAFLASCLTKDLIKPEAP
jgi:hypothetical protein